MTATGLIRIRHTVQWVLLAGFVLLPFSGLFRIDAASGRFLIGSYQIWWDDFFIVFPFWALLFFSMTAFYSNFGMVFCGWFCPQHTLSEWLNNLAKTLFGRRLITGISPERQQGRSTRKAVRLVLSWLAFIAVVGVASMILTLACLHYFFPWDVLWGHFAHGRFNMYIAVFSILVGTFVVVDLGLLRHFWCKYMCPYGLWQYMFRNRDTLQIRFDTARQDDCKSCSLCKDVCPVDLDPRQPEIYTRCINCAICIDACEGYMGRFEKAPILSFGFGTRREELIRIETRRSRILVPAVLWPLSGVVLSAMLLGYGISSFSAVKMAVAEVRSDGMYQGADQLDYTVSLLNKDRVPHAFDLAVEGLPNARVELSDTALTLAPGETETIAFAVYRDGLAYDKPYPFRVLARTREDGQRFVAESVYYLPDLPAQTAPGDALAGQ